jgi:hypothetical protein
MISEMRAMAENDDESPADFTAVHRESARQSLPPAARRALAEAAARRVEADERIAAMPKEIGGRGGKEPVRYGDWEVKGIASDF